jgi:hypothetical protein
VSGARHYALRRVNPFLGTLQVVEVPGARAISPNGARWQVELLSETAVRQPLWADVGPASAERRFFTYGAWSPASGVRRMPINPMLGDQSSHPSLAPLLAALERMPRLPFLPADGLELWLLDPAERPLALVLAVRGDHPPTLPLPPRWRALPPRDRRETARDGEPDAPDPEALERRVATAAGSPPRAQWFRRLPGAAGVGLSGFRLRPDLEGRVLPAGDFPPLLVREDWPGDPGAEDLAAAYLAWQAPVLLTLPDLDREVRARLERQAARRPVALYRQRRLLPEVVDRARVEAALVEAVLRASG